MATVLAGCADAGGAPGAAESLTLVPSQTLVTTESELVGSVYDMTVAPDGNLYVADYGFKYVLVVSPDRSVRRTIGKEEGSGPGVGSGHDFRDDGFLAAAIDGSDNAMVRVIDAGGTPVGTFGEPIAPPVRHSYRRSRSVGGVLGFDVFRRAVVSVKPATDEVRLLRAGGLAPVGAPRDGRGSAPGAADDPPRSPP